MKRKPAAQQGGPDGLCGIYCLLNFLQNHRRFEGDKDREQEILRHLFEAAYGLGLLLPRNLTHGFEAHHLRSVANKVFLDFDLPFIAEVVWPGDRHITTRQFFAEVASICSIGGAYVLSVDDGEHWILAHTVIRNKLICDDPSGGSVAQALNLQKNGRPDRSLDTAHAVIIRPSPLNGYPESNGDL